MNGLTNNGLTNNGLTNNGLTNNGLTNNGLTNNGLLMAQLSQETAREFLTYVVSCALPADVNITLTIDGAPVMFSGELGLAPAWGDDNGSCDNDCKAWVSGCLMARVNKLGDHIDLSLRGSALTTTSTELTDYPLREGAYYGDVFASPQVLFACSEQGSTLIGRVCGMVNGVPDYANCVMNVVGDCENFCDAPSSVDGSFPNCRNTAQTVQYPGSVTVYRQSP